MKLRSIKEYLDQENIKYAIITHSPAYTAQEIAASAHIPGKQLAKSVVIKLDGKLAMAVLPANLNVDMDHLAEVTESRTAVLATEEEFMDQFPDCEVGVMPPFGHLYGMPVYVADELIEGRVIAFNAGSHSLLIQMAYHDFERLVRPRILEFALSCLTPQESGQQSLNAQIAGIDHLCVRALSLFCTRHRFLGPIPLARARDRATPRTRRPWDRPVSQLLRNP
jgi:Ala-tRNA(Pro) deacylase